MALTRIEDSIKKMLEELARQDERSLTKEMTWLIRQEWARRYSQPNPVISVAEAEAAGKATNGAHEES